MPPPPRFGETRYRTVEETRIVEMLMAHGWRFEVAAGHAAAARAAAEAGLGRCVALGLPYRQDADGVRRYDPVETWNFVEWAGLRLGEPLWETHCAAGCRREAWEGAGGTDDWSQPPPPGALRPQRYAVVLRRRFNLDDRAPGERVRLRLPLPIGDAGLTDLRIEPLAPEGEAVRVAAGPARLDVILPVPPAREAVAGVRLAFTAHGADAPAPQPLGPEEAALYTRPSEGLIRLSPAVRALARDLAGDEPDPWAAMRRFWDFLLDEIAVGAIHYDALDPARPLDWVLDRRWCDCRTGAALLAALCRARGIPARLVSGYGLYQTAPVFHSWMEAWFEDGGWRPFDLCCWELSAGGRDRPWRDLYFGHLDHRMTVERLPRLFAGAGAVRLTGVWRRLFAQTAAGSITRFERLDDGALIYSEEVEVRRLGEG